MVLVQKLPFLLLFFSCNIGQENVFYNNLERKKAFLGNKNERFKNSKKLTFFQTGYPIVLVQKWPLFANVFFFGNIGPENVFYDILEQRNAFLGFKDKKFKNPKNWHFSKGVKPWFWSKNGHFFNFFFQEM